MPKSLNLAKMFQLDSDDLKKAREKAHHIHGTNDIKAAGNEVERAVRGYLKRMLPPRYIGIRRSFVVVPANTWDAKTAPRKPLGQWLIENVPRGTNLEVPDRRSNRPIPFIDEG